MKAQTLLKLVALLYSGEVEVNVGVEQNDLLAAAIKFGIMGLVEGQKQAGVGGRCHQGLNCLSCRDHCEGRAGVQDAQVQAEMVECRVLDIPVSAPAGAAEKTASTLDRGEGPSEYVPAQNVDFCVMVTPEHLNIEDNFNTLRSPRIPSFFSKSAINAEPELNCSFKNTTDSTAPWSVNVATTSFDRDSNGRVPQGVSELQSPALGDTMESGSEDQSEESRGSAEQPCSARRAEVPGEDRAKSTEERSALVGRKNLGLMKHMAQMVESTQISIKVKNFKNTFVSPV